MSRSSISPLAGGTIPPVSCFIDPADASLIRRLAPDAERLGRLHPAQLDLIYRRRWFNLFVPGSSTDSSSPVSFSSASSLSTPYNGLGLPLIDGFGLPLIDGLGLPIIDGLHIEEAAAWSDGSFGWTLTLCSGANWFIRFLDPALSRELFSDPIVCLAGSGRPGGIASLQPDGSYIVTGHWKYATGAPHATALTANCCIQRDGKPLLDPNAPTDPIAATHPSGYPLIRSFLFLASEVLIHPDWSATGLIATASHSFSVENFRVPANRCFYIDPAAGFTSFAEATLAVNSSGMAAHFLDLAADLFDHRTDDTSRRERSMQLLQKAQHWLAEARVAFYAAVSSSSPGISAPVDSSRIAATSRHLASTSLQLVDELYPWCGLAAATPGTELNRVWRDIHTASQHGLLLC